MEESSAKNLPFFDGDHNVWIPFLEQSHGKCWACVFRNKGLILS